MDRLRSPAAAPVPRLLALVVCAAALAPGVIIASGDGSGNTSAPPDDPGWRYVGKRAELSAVYLGNGWVATADHVAAGDVVLEGTTYPWVPGSKVQLTSEGGVPADLALFRIDPAPDWPLLPINTDTDLTGKPVVLIGHGRDRGPATSSCETPGPPTPGWQWQGTKTLRWGTNVVDGYARFSTHAFIASFDPAGSAHEALAADGDSGGAVFVQHAGGWALAGIIFAKGVLSCQPTQGSFYGSQTYAADLAAYREDILEQVRPRATAVETALPRVLAPGLPALAGLLLAAGFAAPRRRRTVRY